MGVSPETIRKDLQQATVNGLTVARPERIVGLDGKSRPAKRIQPAAPGPLTRGRRGWRRWAGSAHDLFWLVSW